MKRLSVYLLTLLVLISCSNTKVLEKGQTRLKENKIVIEGNDGPKPNALTSYLKQKSNTYFIGKWSPGLNIYNWCNGKGKGWDKFCKGLGEAPVIFDSTLVEASVVNLKNHLDYLGYYNSDIQTDISTKDKEVTVTYTIVPGRTYTVREVNYIIKNPDLNQILSKNPSDQSIQKGSKLSQSILDKESERIAKLFKNNGYYKISKNYFFYYADTTDVTSKGGYADLMMKMEDYTINESPSQAQPHRAFKIGNIRYNLSPGMKVNPKFLEELNRIKSGEPYSEDVINMTYSRFSSIPMFNTVNIALVEADSTTVNCAIALSQSKLQSIKVGLEGSFNSTGLFGVTPSLSYAHKNIFGGGEQFSISLQGNFQFKFNDPTRATEYAISTSLVFPKFLLLPSRLFNSVIPQTEVTLSFNGQDRPEYRRSIVSTSYGYKWNQTKKMYYNVVPVKFNLVRIFDIDPEFYQKLRDPYLINAYQDHLDFGSNATMLYTTDHAVNPKHTYFYTRLSLNGSGNILWFFRNLMPKDSVGKSTIASVPFAQYVRAEVSAVQTIRFGKDDKLALAGRLLAGAGYAYGNSSALPFEQLFTAGGANSLRGWRARTVGPGGAPLDESFEISNQTGDIHLEANLEFRYPLFWKLWGATFIDAGNIWNLDTGEDRDPLSLFHFKDFIKTCALDWGIGLRLDFDMLLIRVDWGLKTYDPRQGSWCGPKQWFTADGYALNFGIGYPF